VALMVNVKDFGAVGDGVTYDDAAFAAAVAAIVASGGGVLYVPAGEYRLADRVDIVVPNREHVAVKGDGKYTTQLQFEGVTVKGGIRFESTATALYDRPTFEIENIGLIPMTDDCGTALSASWADDQNVEAALTVKGLLANRRSVANGVGSWTRGIDGNHARNSTIADFYFIGKQGVTKEAVRLDGQSTAVDIYDCHILEAETGIIAQGVCEGLNVNQCNIVAVRYGVRHDIATGAEPQLSVANSHINATDVCVWSNNVQQGGIVNNLFYAFSGLGVVNPWWGVIISGDLSRSMKVIGNSFEKDGGHNGPTTHGIHITGGHSYVITGNQFQGRPGSPMTYGVVGTPANTAKGLNTAQHVVNPNI
jgi:hypothetical protein